MCSRRKINVNELGQVNSNTICVVTLLGVLGDTYRRKQPPSHSSSSLQIVSWGQCKWSQSVPYYSSPTSSGFSTFVYSFKSKKVFVGVMNYSVNNTTTFAEMQLPISHSYTLADNTPCFIISVTLKILTIIHALGFSLNTIVPGPGWVSNEKIVKTAFNDNRFQVSITIVAQTRFTNDHQNHSRVSRRYLFNTFGFVLVFCTIYTV